MIRKLVLALVLCLTPLSVMTEAQNQPPTQGQEKPKQANHLCGASTKKGTPCTRKVSDQKGKDTLCWQHAAKAKKQATLLLRELLERGDRV